PWFLPGLFVFVGFSLARQRGCSQWASRRHQAPTVSAAEGALNPMRLPITSVATRPQTRTAIDAENARDQFPVRSTSAPITRREDVPGHADPKIHAAARIRRLLRHQVHRQ